MAKHRQDDHFIEPFDVFEQRVEAFKQWLREREAQTILVYGHHDFFFGLTAEQTTEELIDGRVMKSFEYGHSMDNCELVEWKL